MNRFPKLIALLSTIFALLLLVAPTLADDSATTRTITEQQINESYRVTNPVRRSVSDRAVDLQPGQVVVNEIVTRRGQEPVAVVVVYTPSVQNGRIFWTTVSVTRDGQPVSQEIIDQINNNRQSSWRNYWRLNGPEGRVQSVTISDTEMVITLSARPR